MNNTIAVRSTGNLRDKYSKVSSSIALANQCIFTEISGKSTGFDRKLYLLLLHIAWDDLDTHSKVGKWHEIKESELRSLVDRHIIEKRTERLYESAKRLVQTSVEYRFTENDKRWIGLSSLMSVQVLEKEERDGFFRFRFPAEMVDILKNPSIFTRLYLQFIFSLKSKYSIKMYEICSSLVNLRYSEIVLSADEIRKFLHANEKLEQWSFLYRRAILPAINEINEKSDIAGFRIDHNLHRCGKGGKVASIKLIVTKTQNRILLDKSLQKSAKPNDNVNVLKNNAFKTSTYEKAVKLANGLDIYVLEDEWRRSISQSDIKVKNAEKHFLAFVRFRANKTNKREGRV
ncbi:RepB family plasmid replication initiator protein [Tolypothrix sp. LEGE 11397]|uniref:replication initiation protein n=1 Tax=Tolypothrix sp. LEGE 11397 TaxID=2777971 RepID=UPI00187F4064|nr:RepB family plasmid replication initiator protein [Tolypothrix sp. LEGE 11397]MBE9082848.1 RepB family plasmid replication initiator protein [Tolypothrix sp. LEGE 11397]